MNKNKDCIYFLCVQGIFADQNPSFLANEGRNRRCMPLAQHALFRIYKRATEPFFFLCFYGVERVELMGNILISETHNHRENN